MKSNSVSFLLASLALLMVAAAGRPVNAAVVLDQEHFTTDPDIAELGAQSIGTSFGRAQTFTVGVAGILDSVQVEVGGGGPPVEMRILGTTGGVPDGGSGGSTVLASSTSRVSVGDLHTFDLSAANLTVNLGDILAIEPRSGSGQWRGANVEGGGSYPHGSDYFFNTGAFINNWTANEDVDWHFRTFVENGVTEVIPEPGTAALALCGAGGWLMRRRRAAKSRRSSPVCGSRAPVP